MIARATPLLLALTAACGCNDDDDSDGDDVVLATDPGNRPLARLNQLQYNNAVRDLLGTEKRPADVFPRDEVANGFDNQGNALTTTSVHVELWEGAANLVLDEMFGRVIETTIVQAVEAEDPEIVLVLNGDQVVINDAVALLAEGGIEASMYAEFDGTFEITATASGVVTSSSVPELVITVDGVDIGTFEVTTEDDVFADYTAWTDLEVGSHTVRFTIGNPLSNRDEEETRAVVIDRFAFVGPVDPQTGVTAAYDEFVPCDAPAGSGPAGLPDRTCAEQAVAAFGERAWKRPLTADDVAWAIGFYDAALAAGEDESWSLQYAFRAILLAPDFVYHVEIDPVGEDTVRALDAFEVADRLATFLWSSLPDQELIDRAADGTLLAEGGIEAQAARMLADPRSSALVESLATQWFDIDTLEAFAPDPYLYPQFNVDTSQSMQTELRLVADGFFRGTDDLRTLLLREESWIDDRLASIYGVTFPGEEDGFALGSTGRVGLLGTAGWLTAHSRADAPSAVRRGKWVLESLLCAGPPPPPPTVVDSFEPVEGGGSVRQQEEALRGTAGTSCPVCHHDTDMDPIGFVLYGYDAIGMLRTEDELGYPIDTNVTIDGVAMSTPAELSQWVADDPRLADCVAEITMTYATGRGMRSHGAADTDDITLAREQFEAGGLQFAELVNAVVTSVPFRYRGTPPPPPPAEETP
jgi:hypothetical protein